MDIMSELFGEYYQAKIIEVILENYEEEMTIKDIMKMADTSQGSTYNYIKFLVNKEILVESRKIGKTQLFRLNLENNITCALLLFEHSLVTSELDKRITIVEKEGKPEKETYTKTFESIINLDKNEVFDYLKQEKISEISKYVKSTNVTKKDVDKWQKVTV